MIVKSLIDFNFIKEKKEEIRRKDSPRWQIKKKAKNEDEENEMYKNTIDQENFIQDWERLKQERACVVCLDRVKNIIFLPCAHLAACVECSVSMQKCPVCRAPVEATVRTFS